MFRLVGRTIGPAQHAFWWPGSRPLAILETRMLLSCRAALFGNGILEYILDLAAMFTRGTPSNWSSCFC